uniref:Uncharacterized protein n=1 Tax=Pristionchus pacificus TaxID=54126 RepID=A0A2A6B6A4_PRIPA|eukprot:PDM61412.1 hypothetical protein PRIPAC_50854 [Pristionchus pacificus]
MDNNEARNSNISAYLVVDQSPLLEEGVHSADYRLATRFTNLPPPDYRAPSDRIGVTSLPRTDYRTQVISLTQPDYRIPEDGADVSGEVPPTGRGRQKIGGDRITDFQKPFYMKR